MKKPRVRMVISANRFLVMFQPSRLKPGAKWINSGRNKVFISGPLPPCATLILKSRCAWVLTTLLVMTMTFSKLMKVTKYGTTHMFVLMFRVSPDKANESMIEPESD